MFPGGFTRPTGDLGSQLSRRTDHVETRSPPYVISTPHIVAVRRPNEPSGRRSRAARRAVPDATRGSPLDSAPRPRRSASSTSPAIPAPLNAWDAASAVVIARGGARAIATSSAAAANALGYADGQHLTREQMLGAVAAIAGAVDLPVTADMEAGYGDEADAAAHRARSARGGSGRAEPRRPARRRRDLLPIERFVPKIAAVRAVGDETGVPLVLNARTDVFLGSVGDPATRLAPPIERGGPTSTPAPTASSSPASPIPARSLRSSRGSAAPSAFSPSRARRRSPISPISASPGSASAPGSTAPPWRSPGASRKTPTAQGRWRR